MHPLGAPRSGVAAQALGESFFMRTCPVPIAIGVASAARSNRAEPWDLSVPAGADHRWIAHGPCTSLTLAFTAFLAAGAIQPDFYRALWNGDICS